MRPAVRLICSIAMLALAASCDSDDGPAPSATPVPAIADRPTPGTEVVRRCGSHNASEFDAGVESRIVTAGPVSVVAFRVSPVPDGAETVRNFKVMVRLEAGAEAYLETATKGTSLLYDRARFSDRNVYQLADGERGVRFVGCPDRPALFNGTVLTTGPTAVDLRAVVDGRPAELRVTAYAG